MKGVAQLRTPKSSISTPDTKLYITNSGKISQAPWNRADCMSLLFAREALQQAACNKQGALLPKLQTDTTSFCCAAVGQQLVGVSFAR